MSDLQTPRLRRHIHFNPGLSRADRKGPLFVFIPQPPLGTNAPPTRQLPATPARMLLSRQRHTYPAIQDCSNTFQLRDILHNDALFPYTHLSNCTATSHNSPATHTYISQTGRCLQPTLLHFAIVHAPHSRNYLANYDDAANRSWTLSERLFGTSSDLCLRQ